MERKTSVKMSAGITSMPIFAVKLEGSTMREQMRNLLFLFCVWFAFLGLVVSEVDDSDLDAFGGSPVVSSEIGAVPQQSQANPEVAFPTLQTCRQEGVSPTECSQDCLFNCQTPICSMSCLCACTSSSQKAALTAFLKREQSELELLAVQRDMWTAGEKGFVSNGLVPKKSKTSSQQLHNPSQFSAEVQQAIQQANLKFHQSIVQPQAVSQSSAGDQNIPARQIQQTFEQVERPIQQPQQAISRNRQPVQRFQQPVQQMQQAIQSQVYTQQMPAQQYQPSLVQPEGSLQYQATSSPQVITSVPAPQQMESFRPGDDNSGSAQERRNAHASNIKRYRSMKSLTYRALLKQASGRSHTRRREAPAQVAGTTDSTGFDWNKMAQRPVMRKDPAMSALERESDKIDDVYDPSEDPQNIGPEDLHKNKKPAEWWTEDTLDGAKLNDQWWQHGGEQGMTPDGLSR